MTEGHAECSDEALMSAYARGDGAAFSELFKRYESRAERFFGRRARSEHDVADLYQELFLRLHRARSTYDTSRPFAPWFFQIARRLLVDARRRAAVRVHEVPLVEEHPQASGVNARIEERISARQHAHGLLARLSSIESYVLVAAKVEGRGYAEIARELGKSVVAIKKVASRAMTRMRAAGLAAESIVEI
jgi:RNA polymerase sigma-70 factor (ECF subfamily)